MTKQDNNPLAHVTDYELHHLVAHLAASGRDEDLHRLLQLEWPKVHDDYTSRQRTKIWSSWFQSKRRIVQRRQYRNAWYMNKESIEDTAGYVTDIRHAWRLAEEKFASFLSQGTLLSNPSGQENEISDPCILALALQVRYALVISSFNNLATNVPPALSVALIENGIWSLTQGLAYAHQIPDPMQQAATLNQLSCYLEEPLKSEILWECLAAIQKIDVDESQVRALVDLTHCLSGELLIQAFTIAQDVKNNYQRATALVRIADYLPDPLKTQARDEALATAKAIPWSGDRMDVLLILASYLPERLRQEALQVALTAARQLPEQGETNNNPRATALGRVAINLAKSGYHQEALMTMWAIMDPNIQAKALSEIALYLPNALLHQTQILVWTTHCENTKLQLLLALAPHLPNLAKTNKNNKCNTKVESKVSQAVAMTRLAPYLSPRLRQVALLCATKIQDRDTQLLALQGLVPHLFGPLRDEAVRKLARTVRRIRVRNDHSALVAKLACQLVELKYPDQAIRIANLIKDTNTRTAVFAGLMPHLPVKLKRRARRQAISAAKKIRDFDSRVAALAGLSAHMPHRLLRRLLSKDNKIQERGFRERLMARLASSQAAKGSINNASKIVYELEDPASRARAMIGLAPYLSRPMRDKVLRKALHIIQTIKDPDDQLRLLKSTTAHLPHGLLKDVLATVEKVESTDVVAASLASIAPYLPRQLLHRAFMLADEIQNPEIRDSALAGLVPRLADLGSTQEALSIVENFESAYGRAAAFASLGPRLMDLGSLYLWQADPKRMSVTFTNLWWQVAGLVMTITGLDHSKEISEALWALRVAQRDKIRTVEYKRNLSIQMLLDSLAVIRRIECERARVEALANLVPYLPTQLLRQALTMIAGVETESQRAQALVRLAPYLPGLLLQDATTLARMIQNHNDRARALLAIADHIPSNLRRLVSREALAAAMVNSLPHVPSLLKEEILKETLALVKALHSTSGRTHVLDSLAPYLPRSTLQKAMDYARIIGDGNYRVRTAVRLAPYLSPAHLKKILGNARHIDDVKERAWALTELFPCLPTPLMEQVKLEALATIRSIPYFCDRAEILLSLLDCFSEPRRLFIFREVLTAAQAIPANNERSLVLTELSKYTDDPETREYLLTQSLKSARDIEDAHLRAYTLIKMAAWLIKEDHTYELITAVQTIEESSIRKGVFCSIVPCLTVSLQDKVFQRILALARSVGDSKLKAMIFIAMLARIPKQLKVVCLHEALTATLMIQDANDRANAWKGLLPHLTELSLPTLYALWCKMLRVSATRTRENLLSDIHILVPVIVALGGKKSITKIYQAIQDMGRWWP
ncbi:MAG: hypothetical protein GY832_46840 [Chloroflexi bacterium]|nr:hypothetical protein [Chloroflexota bacterium]